MEFVATLAGHPEGLAQWHADREAEGWRGVAVIDHLSAGDAYPHVWTALGLWAGLGGRMQLTTAFANNLVRSPVEFAHASLSIQELSGGRFEAGLGAGWRTDDLAGAPLPDGPARARRYREAMQIVRDILKTQRCSFHGEFYDIELADQPLPALGCPPPLVAAVGGPWVIDNVAPLADRVELMAFYRAARPGVLALGDLGRGEPDEIARLATRARAANPNAPPQVGVAVAAGTGPIVDEIAAVFNGGPHHGLAGEPERVAHTLSRLQEHGIDRVTMVELVPDTYRRLAPFLHFH